MKYFLYILLILSIVMIGFNIFQINFNAPFGKESKIALIAVLAASCVALLIAILLISKAIERKHKELSN